MNISWRFYLSLCLPRSSRREALRGPQATADRRRAGTGKEKEEEKKGSLSKVARETKHACATSRPASKHDFSLFPVWPASPSALSCQPVSPQFTRGTASHAPGSSAGLLWAPQPAACRQTAQPRPPKPRATDHRPPTVQNFEPSLPTCSFLFHPPRSSPSAIGARA